MAAEDGTKQFKGNSTVSRYACRIQCERSPPYSARLYAAAFDEHGRIQLSVSGDDISAIVISYKIAVCHMSECAESMGMGVCKVLY